MTPDWSYRYSTFVVRDTPRSRLQFVTARGRSGECRSISALPNPTGSILNWQKRHFFGIDQSYQAEFYRTYRLLSHSDPADLV